MHKQHILIIGAVWPEPKSSAAGLRIIKLIEYFKELDYQITFASSAEESPYMFDLTELKIDSVSIKLNDSSFDKFVKELNPTIVLFDRFFTEEQFGWRVIEQCPNALRILDTIDLHCLRQARQTALKQNREFEKKDLLSDIAKREIASILRSDLSLIISEYEMELLTEYFKINSELLFYLPILVEPVTEEIKKTWKDFELKKDFVFIGNFVHDPNADAVVYLKEKIWNKIRNKIPDANLNIYGAYPSQRILNLHKPEQGFCVYGRTPNSDIVISNARVSLAPLRFGAGIKGKLLESMICGTPSITTSIGAEGMNSSLPWSGFIADSAEEFIEKSILLYSDKNIWLKSQAQGIDIINTRFTDSYFKKSFFEKVKTIQVKLDIHRESNFIGAILIHHTLMSSKYMSKWIEEKNSKITI